ncbi:MAG: hypothetical protein WAW87_03895 [Candidatus Ferrigenium altingense]
MTAGLGGFFNEERVYMIADLAKHCVRLEAENELLRKSMSEALIETMLIASGFAGYALQLAPNDWRTDHILKRIKTVEQLLTPNAELRG